jgi:hypothetical protein
MAAALIRPTFPDWIAKRAAANSLSGERVA